MQAGPVQHCSVIKMKCKIQLTQVDPERPKVPEWAWAWVWGEDLGIESRIEPCSSRTSIESYFAATLVSRGFLP